MTWYILSTYTNEEQKMSIIQSSELIFKNESSHKRYAAVIEKSDDLYIVKFEYGAVGKSQKSGLKTVEPVALDAAMKIYQKLLTSKIKKGYIEQGESRSINVSLPEDSGFQPLLLKEVQEDGLNTMLTGHFIMQRKYDGVRQLIEVNSKEIKAINKKGQYTNIAAELAEEAASINHDFVIDGEGFGGHIVAFDLLSFDGVDYRKKPYAVRLTKLLEEFSSCKNIKVISSHEQNKQGAFEHYKSQRYEGVVFKDPSAQYLPSRTQAYQKFKFTKSLSALVNARNEGKRSVNISLLNCGKKIDIGNVTIPSNHNIPNTDAIVEINYLYAHDSNKLCQPIFKGLRQDISADECQLSQLVFAAR
jgi:bifunctional non-homologous end joining protein LigD